MRDENSRWQQRLKDAESRHETLQVLIDKYSERVEIWKSEAADRGEELEATKQQLAQRDAELNAIRDREESCEHLPSDSEHLVCAVGFPKVEKVDAADLLNQLKGRRKRSRADLADVEAILEILGDCGDE